MTDEPTNPTLRDMFACFAPREVPMWFLDRMGKAEIYDHETIMVKWRWHYADAMLTARKER